MKNLFNYKHIHFTGIKGVAMTSVALCINDMDIKITGSDVEEIFVTDEVLKKAGIIWQKGFGEKNLVPKPDLLITTAAHGGLNNPEVVAAKTLGIEVITYADALSLLAKSKKLLSVCGVGGKGSTASMIASILNYSKLDPSYAIGMGNIMPLGSSGKYSQKGKFFICEADEYAISPGVINDPKFSLLNPYITVVTNIEHDHPDIYPTFKDTLKVYKKFLSKTPKNGVVIANFDNKNTQELMNKIKVPRISYGFNKLADWVASEVKYGDGFTEYKLKGENEQYIITVNLPGDFNVLNSVAAFIVAKQIGVKPQKIISELRRYKGARRRYEFMGKKNGVIYYDDYAHHPGEIISAIAAAKKWYPKRRLVTIFQPHTYSRTKALLSEFGQAFNQTDIVGIMDIYASARESKDDSISSEILCGEIMKNNKKSYYLKNQDFTLDWLNKNTKRGDVVLTLGAGDIFHLYNSITFER
jgi:UDP-N-acetylmuramate--alanine ligase